MQNLLNDYGIDYDKGIANCIGNIELYKKILLMFLEDKCFILAAEAFKDRKYKKLFESMHEIKGVSGNAAFTGLYKATIPLVKLLRDGTDDDEEVKKLFLTVEKEYDRTCDGIRYFISQNP